jgi:site-specific recombinase XerD
MSPRRTATPLKSPRATGAVLAAVSPIGSAGVGTRGLERDLYAAHLRAAPSTAGDLYSPQTVRAYLDAIDALAAWCDATGKAGGFLHLTAADLDAYFLSYRQEHTQGGTNTRQRRLRTFFRWLVVEVDPGARNPMDGVTGYSPSEPAPRAYGGTFAADVLATCSDRRDFEDVRDEAILRLIATGVRRGELAGLYVEDVDLARGTVLVAALKGTRRHAPVLRMEGRTEVRQGRLVPIGAKTAAALGRWLTMRARHKLVSDPATGPLWMATRGRGRLKGRGILTMVKRRGLAAGYDPAEVTAHGFRHTRTDDLLRAGVAEGDVMAIMGWRDREMLDRYAANLKTSRAHEAVRTMGLVD